MACMVASIPQCGEVEGTGFGSARRPCRCPPTTPSRKIQHRAQLRSQAGSISDTRRRRTYRWTSLANNAKMSLVSGEKSNFQFIIRLLNTNVRSPKSGRARVEGNL